VVGEGRSREAPPYPDRWPIAPDRGLQFFSRCWEHSGHRPALPPQGSVANDTHRKSSTWFPGFTEEMIAQGALPGDLVDKGLWFNHGVYLCNVPSKLNGLGISRPMLERSHSRPGFHRATHALEFLRSKVFKLKEVAHELPRALRNDHTVRLGNAVRCASLAARSPR
jgi:hypothetical protein